MLQNIKYHIEVNIGDVMYEYIMAEESFQILKFLIIGTYVRMRKKRGIARYI